MDVATTVDSGPLGERPLLRLLLQPGVLLAALLATVAIAVLIGLPTAVIPNPWFVRMTPAGTSNYFFWIASSLLTGALLATYALPRSAREGIAAATAGSGYLGLLAVGCPVCNKLIVALLGVSGAFTYFAPIQPLLGAAGLALAATGLLIRLRGARRVCARLPTGGAGDSAPAPLAAWVDAPTSVYLSGNAIGVACAALILLVVSAL